MLILFPHQPFAPTKPDFDFVAECSAASSVGFQVGYYDHEALEVGDTVAALRHLPHLADSAKLLILRGWMVPGERYKALYDTLCNKGYAPQTTPAAYDEPHYFPLAYQHLAGATARSVWIPGDDAVILLDLITYSFSVAETKTLPGTSSTCGGTIADTDKIQNLALVALSSQSACYTAGAFDTSCPHLHVNRCAMWKD